MENGPVGFLLPPLMVFLLAVTLFRLDELIARPRRRRSRSQSNVNAADQPLSDPDGRPWPKRLPRPGEQP